MMLRVGVLVTLAVGCGRVGFDAQAVGDAARDAIGADATLDAGCSVQITAAMDTMPSGWTFDGEAMIDSTMSAALLTDSSTLDGTGSVTYATAVVLDTFIVELDFSIGGGNRGDGMAFVMERDSSDFVGDSGEGLDIAGTNGYGVELDTFENVDCTADPDLDNNHVGIDDLTACAGTGSPTALTAAPVTGFDLEDGAWHHAAIQASNGTMIVTLDGVIYIDGFALPGWVAGMPYYPGIASANGSMFDSHWVKNVTLLAATPCT